MYLLHFSRYHNNQRWQNHHLSGWIYCIRPVSLSVASEYNLVPKIMLSGYGNDCHPQRAKASSGFFIERCHCIVIIEDNELNGHVPATYRLPWHACWWHLDYHVVINGKPGCPGFPRYIRKYLILIRVIMLTFIVSIVVRGMLRDRWIAHVRPVKWLYS